MQGYERVWIEADGGSRGNPGPAGFGAVLKDAATGGVIAEAAESIGVATNNVAEYRGLIAGLELFTEYAPDARLEVRMDSKLVIEQMAGRWKVKHQDMRPLALQARRLAPADTQWTWVPRAQNSHADRLANKAMDAAARSGTGGVAAVPGQRVADVPPRVPDALFGEELAFEPGEQQPTESPTENVSGADTTARSSTARQGPLIGWTGMTGVRTELVFLRHGVTWHTTGRRFSGPGGEDPGLIEAGQAQAARAAESLAAAADVDVLLSSPLRRTRETAQAVADRLDLPVIIEPGFRESAFGVWDGLTLDEAREGWPTELDGWLHSTSVPAPGGESVDVVRARVEAALAETIETYAGQRVVVVSHVTPIKLALRACLRCDWEVTHHMLLAPGSLTTMWFFDSGASVLRDFSVVP